MSNEARTIWTIKEFGVCVDVSVSNVKCRKNAVFCMSVTNLLVRVRKRRTTATVTAALLRCLDKRCCAQLQHLQLHAKNNGRVRPVCCLVLLLGATTNKTKPDDTFVHSSSFRFGTVPPPTGVKKNISLCL